MQRYFKVFVIVVVLLFAGSVFAFDINTYLEKYHVRKSLTPETRWKARMYIDKKTGTEYKIPAGKVSSTDYCRTGSCNYTWSTQVPQYNGNTLVGYRTITGTAEKVQKQGVGTVTVTRDSEGKYLYIKIHKSDGFKESIFNGDTTGLQKINEVTGKYGVYYKAQIYKGYIRNIRTGERELVDKIRLVKVKTPEEAGIIEDLRGQGSGESGGSGEGGSF
ncbi:MAG: hypothetical protein ABDH16_02385 [Thermodesulfovibrionaceae bacterium]